MITPDRWCRSRGGLRDLRRHRRAGRRPRPGDPSDPTKALLFAFDGCAGRSPRMTEACIPGDPSGTRIIPTATESDLVLRA
ncbi:hypothetical protein A33M_3069 [Rhodovulum sp. PH10]|nr:hypothetical protein A33M_3069 [Rhodovulum sp. PH10]